MEDRAVQDLVSRFTPDTRGHGMSHMFGNTNPEAKGLSQVRWKQGIVDPATDRFHSGKLKEWPVARKTGWQ